MHAEMCANVSKKDTWQRPDKDRWINKLGPTSLSAPIDYQRFKKNLSNIFDG